ncbi:MAG: hypothetical protein HZB51_02295 [Chloroflexi bacterium]|nr:hypothetical protein [Chloroflexota bacterium]
MGLVRFRHLHFFFLAALLFFGVAAAPPPGVSMQVEPFFHGHFKFGEWLPLRVTLANDGAPLHAELRADVTDATAQTVYVVPVELPTGARKRVTIYTQPPSFARALRIRLVETSNPNEPRELDSQTIQVTVERNVNYLVGVIAPRMQSFNALTGLVLNSSSTNQSFKGMSSPARRVSAFSISLSDIPDRPEGLRVLDALVISGSDTSALSTEQQRALEAWVDQGGRLIIGGGAGAARTMAGLPDNLVRDFRSTNATAEVQTLAALGKFGEEDVRVSGPFAVTWASSSSSVLLEQDNRALLLNKRVGKGNVNYSALDLAASPFDAWAGATRFWEKLLTPDSNYPSGAPVDVSPRASRANNAAYALQNLPALELPSIGWLAGLLAVYVLMVGPVNYLVLRRLHKLAWGWVTIPALTLVFSASAFAFAYNVRGSDVIINKISILNFGARAAEPVLSYVGIFSPERTAYTLNFPGHSLASPISFESDGFGGRGFGGGGTLASSSAAEIVEGDPVQVRGVQVNQWSMQGFQIESAMPDGWGIESNLLLDGERVRGTVVNRTPETVSDAVLVVGNYYTSLGNLAPGDSRSIDKTLQNANHMPFPYFLFEGMNLNSGSSMPSRESQMRQQFLGSFFQGYNGPAESPSRPTLIGWMRASPLDVQIPTARWATQQTSLVVADLKVEYPRGPIHLSPGTVTVRVTSMDGSVGICGSNTQLSINSGSAILEYQLPGELATMRVTQLSLLMPSDGLTVEVFDQAGMWIKLDATNGGYNNLSNPTRFVSSDGIVRVRVSGNNNSGSCDSFLLDVEGNN